MTVGKRFMHTEKACTAFLSDIAQTFHLAAAYVRVRPGSATLQIGLLVDEGLRVYTVGMQATDGRLPTISERVGKPYKT